jgi:hypothetical protein
MMRAREPERMDLATTAEAAAGARVHVGPKDSLHSRSRANACETKNAGESTILSSMKK